MRNSFLSSQQSIAASMALSCVGIRFQDHLAKAKKARKKIPKAVK